MKFGQRAGLGLLLVAATVQLTGCHRDKGKVPESITIGTFSRAIDYSPFYVAKHFRWFEGTPELRGVSVRYVEFNDREAISAALARNEIQAVFAAEPPFIVTRAQANDIRIVENSCTLQQEVVVRSALPVQSVRDLRGRTIAVLRATSSHYGLLKILRAAGLSGSDVHLQFMGPNEAKAAFDTDRIDAWAVWPPFVEQEQVSGRGRVLAGGEATINSVMALPTPLLNNNEAIAKGLVSVIQKAKQWILANPQEAQSIVANELGLDMEVIRTAWGKHDWSAHLTEPVIADIQAKADFLAAEGLTRMDRKLDVRRDLIELRFTPK